MQMIEGRQPPRLARRVVDPREFAPLLGCLPVPRMKKSAASLTQARITPIEAADPGPYILCG